MNIKGVAWMYFLQYMEENLTPSQIDTLKTALDNEGKALFEARILPTSWVDYSLFMKVFLTADKVIGRGDLTFIRECCSHISHYAIKGFHRVLISALSPKMVINTALKLWKQMYDKGNVTIQKLTSNTVVFRVEHVEDIPLFHELESSYFFEGLLRMAGAKNVKWSHLKCMARKDSHCLFEFTWE